MLLNWLNFIFSLFNNADCFILGHMCNTSFGILRKIIAGIKVVVIFNLNSAKVLCENPYISIHLTNGLNFLSALILTMIWCNQSF